MKQIGFVCFGEVNTPFERLVIKHDGALKTLGALEDARVFDAGIVIDDPAYETADAAVAKLLAAGELDCVILCVAGWVPTHAVIRVTDRFRHLPMLSGAVAADGNGHLVTTADQAGTTAIRPALAAMHYRFAFVYSVIGKPEPIERIRAFTSAAYAAKHLRTARVGTMGYRDMLLYGTQFEGNSMRGQIGVEVEPFEMLEIVQLQETLDPKEVADAIAFVRKNWVFDKSCDDRVLETGVRDASQSVKNRNGGYER